MSQYTVESLLIDYCQENFIFDKLLKTFEAIYEINFKKLNTKQGYQALVKLHSIGLRVLVLVDKTRIKEETIIKGNPIELPKPLPVSPHKK